MAGQPIPPGQTGLFETVESNQYNNTLSSCVVSQTRHFQQESSAS